MEEMNCAELVERVTDYLDDALPPVDQVRLDDHIAVCFGCVAHLDEVQTMLHLAATIPAEPLSGDLETRLLTLHREWARGVRA